MKKLLILTGVVLTLIVIYPKETWEIFRKVETIVSNHFSTETVKSDDLIKRNDLYYEKHTDIPFTGKVESYYNNGQLMYKGTFKDGKKEGPWVGYNHNGQLSYKGTFKDGKDEGPWVSYWDNGQLSDKGTSKDGKREGPWVFFNKDGTKRFTPHKDGYDEGTGTYKDGKKISD